MLAPDPTGAQTQLTALFNANNLVTAWVQALENAVLPVLDPQPSWYQAINTSLQASQKGSMSWLTTSGPQLHASVSQSFISYDNYFAAVAPQLTTLVQKIAAAGNVPTAQQQALLTTYVQQLLTRARASRDTVQAQQSALAAFHTQMASDHDAITQALEAAVKDEGTDRVAIDQVRQQITAIMQEISKNTTLANGSSIAYGVGIVSLIAAFTIGLALSGGTLALGGFALTVLGLGKDFASEEIYTEDVDADFNQLATLMGQLAEDQQQLAMVQGVATGLQSLLDSNDQALEGFAAFTDVWDWTVYGLESLMVVLAQPQIDVGRIPDLNDLDAAAAAWSTLSAFAQKIQAVPVQQQQTMQLPAVTITPNLQLVR